MEMTIAAMIDRTEKVIIVPLTEDARNQIHSIQAYGERFLEEHLILSSAPGEVELSPHWTWKFMLDPGLYDLDSSFDGIPMYKDQQH